MNNQLVKAVFGNKLNKSYKLSDILSMLDKSSYLHMGEITEVGISNHSGVARCKKLTENIDLVTKKQIKYAKTYKRSAGSWCATVSRNTTAPMLVVVDEQCTGKQYYFYIPFKAHRHLKGNTINMSFGTDGCYTDGIWFDYQVKNFDTLCKFAK
jgi:hypothetical protein